MRFFAVIRHQTLAARMVNPQPPLARVDVEAPGAAARTLLSFLAPAAAEAIARQLGYAGAGSNEELRALVGLRPLVRL